MLGELGKFATMSRMRFSGVNSTTESEAVRVRVRAGDESAHERARGERARVSENRAQPRENVYVLESGSGSEGVDGGALFSVRVHASQGEKVNVTVGHLTERREQGDRDEAEKGENGGDGKKGDSDGAEETLASNTHSKQEAEREGHAGRTKRALRSSSSFSTPSSSSFALWEVMCVGPSTLSCSGSEGQGVTCTCA